MVLLRGSSETHRLARLRDALTEAAWDEKVQKQKFDFIGARPTCLWCAGRPPKLGTRKDRAGRSSKYEDTKRPTVLWGTVRKGGVFFERRERPLLWRKSGKALGGDRRGEAQRHPKGMLRHLAARCHRVLTCLLDALLRSQLLTLCPVCDLSFLRETSLGHLPCRVERSTAS